MLPKIEFYMVPLPYGVTMAMAKHHFLDEDFMKLLMLCDINIEMGEDSFEDAINLLTAEQEASKPMDTAPLFMPKEPQLLKEVFKQHGLGVTLAASLSSSDFSSMRCLALKISSKISKKKTYIRRRNSVA
jgi:hypothetical protein